MRALEELVDGDRLPMLFDARAMGWMDPAARAHSRSCIAR
jgi:hypothetical protein